MAMQKIFYKDDIHIELDFGWASSPSANGNSPDYRIRMEFFTTDPMHTFVAEYRGAGYLDHIAQSHDNSKNFIVQLHGHGLQPGPLRMKRTIEIPEYDSHNTHIHTDVDYLNTGILLSSGLNTVLSSMNAPAPIERTVTTPILRFNLAEDVETPGAPDRTLEMLMPGYATDPRADAYGYYGEEFAKVWGSWDIDTLSDDPDDPGNSESDTPPSL